MGEFALKVYAPSVLKHLICVYWQTIEGWQDKFLISNSFFLRLGEKAEASYSDEVPFCIPAFTQPLEVEF